MPTCVTRHKNIFFLILFCLTVYQTQGKTVQIDSLQKSLVSLLSQNKMDAVLDTRRQLAQELFNADEYDKSREQRQEALLIAKSTLQEEIVIECLYYIARCYLRTNNYEEALENFTEVVNRDNREGKESYKARALTEKSTIYQALGNYERAFEIQMEALRLHEVAQDSVNIASALYKVASIFFYQEQFKQSLEYYQRCKAICDILGNQRLIYSCLAALGSVYDSLDKQNLSLEYNNNSLKLALKLNYRMGIAYSTGNIGSNLYKKGEYGDAKNHILNALYLKKEIGDKWGQIGSNLTLAEVYIASGHPHKAIPHLEECLAISYELKTKPRRLEAYEQLYIAYEKMKDKDQSFIYMKNYVALKDSIFKENTAAEQGQVKRRYDLAEKENEITVLKKEKQVLDRDKQIQKLQIFIFAFFAIFLLAFLAWFLSRLKLQRKMNSLLEEKNEKLNEMNDEIHIKNKQLECSNEDLQQFAYVASHDLKEPLRMIHSYTSLLERRYKDQMDESGKEFMHFIVDAVDRMKILLDDLLDYSRAGNSEKAPEMISVEDMMVIVESNLRFRFEDLNGTLVVKNENLPSIKSHRTQLMQLLQNLVSNGVKFNKPDRDPIVTVDCEKKDNLYVFSVKDNGIGISEENLNKVFEMFRRLHSREEYEGTGIGLATCKRIVSNMGGDIWVESVEGEGSTFFFSVPVPVGKQVEEMAEMA